MRKSRFILNALTIVAITLAATALAQAQATRTWVSGVGDDANPCSRTAPCKTFAGAISKTAPSGEISVLDPGGFGAVTITKSITINGDGTLAGILASLTNGVIVNDSTTGSPGSIVVYLRSLSINGAGNGTNGINYISGSKLFIENCTITGFTSAVPNGNGIFAHLTLSGKSIFVRNVSIRNCSNKGISIETTTGFIAGIIDRVTLEGLPTGLLIGNNAFVTVRDSNISVNSSTGVSITGSGTPTGSFDNVLVNNNPTGINVGSAAAIMNLSSSTIQNSSTAIVSTAPQINLRSSGNNRLLGNVSDGAAMTVILQK